MPGLSIVFVLDSETSVAYLTDDLLKELGLSPEEALALARENLSRPMDMAAVVRGVLEQKSLSLLKAGDTSTPRASCSFPPVSRRGRSSPPSSPTGTRSGSRCLPRTATGRACARLARTPAGDILWREPLRVTRNGIAPVG